MGARFNPQMIERVVLKVGSSSIVGRDGEVRLGFLGQLVTLIGRLRATGRGVTLVTSGAIAMGYTRLGFPQRPTDIPSRQACAAAGQTELMTLYQKLLDTLGVQTGQVLLTREDFENRRRYLNAREALLKLMELGLVPVVNENDSVAVEEIQYGDNDLLSALVAGMVDADLLVLMTDVDGLYRTPPDPGQRGELLDTLDGPIESWLAGVKDRENGLGSGGMRSKLEAANLARQYGIHCVIARSSGRVLADVLAGKSVGTYITPYDRKLPGRQRWLSAAAGTQGSLTLDAGAVRAVLEGGKSLLPIGVTKVTGTFLRGAVVGLEDGDGFELGRAAVRYRSDHLIRILGRQASEIEAILGYTFGDEVVHRDDMVLIQNGRTT